jgi:hypothetical protein
MSSHSRKRSKSVRERLAERMAAERRQVRQAPNAGQVIAQLGDHLAAREGSRAVQLPLGGARPNNMAPHKYSGPIRILQQGIDSIWLNIHGTINEDVIECLQAGKEEAQVADGDWALSPLPPYDGTNLRVYASGVKHYDYLCLSDDIEVKIRKPSNSPRPPAVVRISAQALWRLGGGGLPAVRAAAVWLRPLFGDDYRVTLSKVHIATDYQGWEPTYADLENVVSRVGDKPIFGDVGLDAPDLVMVQAHRDRAKRLTGVSAGASDNLRLNFYDKRLQVCQQHIGWVEALWESCAGYDAAAPVWRCEFQFGREFLHKRGIETLEDMYPQLAALWSYATGWYSFRTPSPTDTNRSRWEVAPHWQALAVWRSSTAGELPKIQVVRPRFRQLCAGLVGYLTSAMAITELPTPGEALRAALEVIEAQKGALGLDRAVEAKRLRYAGFTMASA